MKNSILFVGLFVFLLYACEHPEYRATYIIENATSHNVEIRFYDRQSNIYAPPVLIDTRNVNGPGILFKEARSIIGTSARQVPMEIYGADSLAVIFDGQLVEAHYNGLPLGSSLAFFSDYNREENGNIYRYVITKEDYENAVPCEEGCN